MRIKGGKGWGKESLLFVSSPVELFSILCTYFLAKHKF